MAIINCPECGKEISNLADVCIHCGFPVKKYVEPMKQPVEPVQQAAKGQFSGSISKGNNVYGNQSDVKKTENMLTGSDVQRISERMKQKAEEKTEKQAEWWKKVITFICCFCPALTSVGVILLWVWEIPKERDRRILASILVILYPVVLYMQFS